MPAQREMQRQVLMQEAGWGLKSKFALKEKDQSSEYLGHRQILEELPKEHSYKGSCMQATSKPARVQQKGW